MKPLPPESVTEPKNMQQITCPWCGLRDQVEFKYGGPSHVVRPAPYDQVSDEVWADYLFNRTNTKGVHRERWLHFGGCRRWFNLVRSTVNHEITRVYRMDEAAPSVDPEGRS
jgi:sarcosine oxidase subunit delta